MVLQTFFSASFWGWVLSLFIGLIACGLVFWGVRRWMQKSAGEEEGSPVSKSPAWWIETKKKLSHFFAQYGYIPHDPLSRSFAYALQVLQNIVGGRGYRYRLPWLMVLGEEGSGKSSLLESLRLPLPVGAPSWSDRSLPCGWWFFDHGVVLDVQGRLVLEQNSLESNEQEWHLLLNLLVNHRPNRPLDGIVLTISCQDLLTRSLSELSVRAEAIYAKFWEVQRMLGMKLPVFVMITHCDKVPGFTSFCQEIPAENRDDMFGWSNPYPLEMAYKPSWMDEMFQHIGDQLIRLQQEIFTYGKVYTERDGLLLFPREFEKLYEPLSVYLNRVFKGDNLYENFFFRGVFFSGDSQVNSAEDNPLFQSLEASFNTALSPVKSSAAVPGAPAEGGVTRQAQHSIYFSTALFREKIFVEKGLVRFVRRRFLANSKTLRASQLGILLLTGGGIIGLMHAYSNLMDARSLILPSINRIGYAIQRSLSGQSQTTTDHAFFQQQATLVLQAMTEVRSERLFSFFIPNSWLSPLDNRIQKVLTVAYDVVILRAIAYEIRRGVEDAISGNLPPIQEKTKESERINPEQSPAFLQLQQYISELTKFQNLIAKYNDLQDTGNLTDFGFVLETLFGKVLTPDFYRDVKGIYRQALVASRIQPIGFYEYTDRATGRVHYLSEAFIQQALDPAKLTPQIERLQKALKEFSYAKASYTVDQLRELVQTLSHTISIFTNPEAVWLERETFSPGAGFNDLVGKMASSNFFQPSLIDEFIARCGEAFQEFRGVVVGYRSPLTGPLFVLDNNINTPFVSPALLNLQGFLNLLLAQPFMSAVEETPIQTSISPNMTLIWNYATLYEASKLMGSFERFFTSKLSTIPDDMKETLRLICLKGLYRTLGAKIAQAQQFVPLSIPDSAAAPEEIFLGEVQNLRAVLPLLTQILKGLQVSKSAHFSKKLQEVLERQGTILLERIDDIFEADKPYHADNDAIQNWRGSLPQLLAVFGTIGLEQLKTHLGLQRQRMHYLAKEFTEPAVQLLEEIYKNDLHKPHLASKWRDILTQLSLYNRKSPSTIQTLEEFIISELPQMDLENCPIILGMAKGAATDYFQEKLQNIRDAFGKQCRGENTKASESAYNKIANYFNENLAGRYPFVPKGFTSYPDADITSVIGFYALFDAQGPYAQELLRVKLKKKNLAVKPALAFLQRMQKLRSFFEPFLTSPQNGDGGEPSIPFELYFRTNEAHEKNGNQIISWLVSIGDESYDFTKKKVMVRWPYSSPIKVEIRFALGSPYRPVEASDQAALSVGPLSATYTYKGCWAFLRMLEAQKAPTSDFDEGIDPQPTTLRFDVPTVPKDRVYPSTACDETPAAPLKTRLFMSVKLVKPSANGITNFNLPSFPVAAPPMNSPAPDRPSGKKVNPPKRNFTQKPCSAETGPCTVEVACPFVPTKPPDTPMMGSRRNKAAARQRDEAQEASPNAPPPSEADGCPSLDCP